MVKTKRTMPVDAQFAAVDSMRMPSGERMDAVMAARLLDAATAAAVLATILLSGYMVAVG